MSDSETLARVLEQLLAARTPAGGAARPPVPAGGLSPSHQPIGISFTLTVPMPDGGELPVSLHFGPEAAGNIQGLAVQLQQQGWPIKVYPPRERYGRSPGGYYGNGRARGWGRY